ncbi:OsmC family protein [Luteimonas sp. R10]|uniref:OsmC family protein n=1 Tax=Luteimonas sp. R10 TaxID=3108176 RepID=UPI00308DF7C4|nr:OsmC family protein [Luteimonas sp. R10]
MSEHRASIRWTRGDTPFEYQRYPRDHTWEFDSGQCIAASAAPGYLGSEQAVDPEEALVAALSSCHMLTLLAIAAKKGWTVDAYEDDAVGVLEKNDAGKLAVTRVTLRPRIAFADGAAPDAGALERLHAQGHEHCFIANSVRTAVAVEPQ